MGPNDIIELLKTLSEKTRAYETAKNELNEVQKKLHGTPYLFSRNGLNTNIKNGLVQKQDQACAGPSRVKRGRGRPKKIKNDIKTTLDQDDNDNENDNDNETVKNNNNMIEINRTGDDAFSSCETYCSDIIHDNREEEHRDCYEDDTRPDFKDAVYAFIADNIYIETRYGNYYDVNTLELRGWYNPYTGKQEGLL
jgi:hypothetical protein